jgi:hypothetical protein
MRDDDCLPFVQLFPLLNDLMQAFNKVGSEAALISVVTLFHPHRSTNKHSMLADLVSFGETVAPDRHRMLY